ncbi:amidohydrolase family protein [Acidobacteria bacterium AH-259-D05]|nr:amidohydrolase family protein [Acidobacteria bacterium AH-259-D05]
MKHSPVKLRFFFFGLTSLLWFGLAVLSSGQLVGSQTAPQEGIRNNTPQVHALVNARIVQASGRIIDRGIIVLRDGNIEAVGADIAVPADARVWDYDGMTVYPGLIETYSQVGLDQPEAQDGESSWSEAEGGIDHWNPMVHPQDNTADLYAPEEEALKKLRALGFTAALVAPDGGVFRGSSALVSLGDGKPNQNILREEVAQHLAFARSRRRSMYPNSLMGVIALMRQTFMDAGWYQQAHAAYNLNPSGQTPPEENEALGALNRAVQGQQPVMILVEDELAFLRATKIAQEFDLQLWVGSSGHEYRQLDLIKAANVPVILPLNFPEAPKVETPEEALNVSLTELQHWDAAPENPRRLQAAGIPFTLTSAELKKQEDFHARVHQAIERGLSRDVALAALTIRPARLLGMARQLGSIEAGKLGHLLVTDGELFAEKTKVMAVWIDGKHYEVNPKPLADPRGRWQLTLSPTNAAPVTATLELKGTVDKLTGSIEQEEDKIDLQRATLELKRLSLMFAGDDLGHAGVIRMTGAVEKESISGRGELADGQSFRWTASWLEPLPEEPAPAVAEAEPALPVMYPPGAFGRPQQPLQPNNVLIRNATIWTSASRGKLEEADMLVTEGKITQIGQNLRAPRGAEIIEAQGKHLTPGLIDAHSHSGTTGGLNEGTQAVTAEVRVEDVLLSSQITLYRELAGGLTVANVLHGSANPIGGQNAVIKLRWGAPPEEMKFEGAIPGIKFALGENVKQSNWGDEFTTRYPQTRMGIEQIIRDRFKAALDYDKEWQAFKAIKNKRGVIPPRRDLELETLLEITQGKRLVHSHSYRQDEILMLVRVADDFGFTIGTFQHVLEGYKVADVLAQHGAGASTFSNWWAYKFEVIDAIPYNGALMHQQGVVVSFNSDSAELARRLNTEAAKAVKYGGVSEEEALKFVTLNPAKQLRVDDRVGSLEVGKDADFVIWSGHPLSTYSRCEQTWIDGRKYFDREEDLKMRKQIRQERARLIQKVLKSKKDKDKEEEEESKPATE